MTRHLKCDDYQGSRVTLLRNAPSGWAAFRAFRQRPLPVITKRHGNWRHGRYSIARRADAAVFRLMVSLLKQGYGDRPTGNPACSGWRSVRLRSRPLGLARER